MSASYSVGIDLGTTNCVLAFARLDDPKACIEIMAIPQIVAPGQLEHLPSLPSFLYLPTPAEVEDGGLLMPTGSYGPVVVGDYARRISAEQPERTIAAAKSWLCHSRVDRHAPILPWDAPDEIGKISPVQASQMFLQHLVDTWNSRMSNFPLHQQSVVLTVPASFDLVARELTREAALAAGLPPHFVLLEEPQAAVYHWISASGDRWRRQVERGDSILVCDVGGGTTDLTLVQVEEDAGELTLRRLAVGSHLLIGGDNMDLALAHAAASRFAEQGTRLNAWQSVSLWHACRSAKESLLSGQGVDPYSITVHGRGSRLIGGSVSIGMARADVERILVDGFFPYCDATDRPQRFTASGFQELGLLFEGDTAITKHVAAFIGEQNSEDSVRRWPNRLLFNGGVFKSDSLRQRMTQVVQSWSHAHDAVTVLGNEDAIAQDLDQSVACGAAYYGWSKQNGGVRIRGGTARSYYVGIETAGLAIPGMPRPLQAICVVPFGMEEGTHADVPGREVGLVVGQSARFRFFASAHRQQDQVGQTLRQWDEDELVETSPLELTLETNQSAEGNFVPVRFRSVISELGMLELWCMSTRNEERWKLEFNVREEVGNGE